MRRLLRSISVCVIALALVTQVSPTFAWEAAGGEAFIDPHGPESHEGSPSHGTGAAHQGHGCAGHMLGHLVAMAGSAGTLAQRVALSGDGALHPAASFASRPIAVPEHPPKS